MPQTNRLSNREWDVLELLLQGKSNKLIALSLDISVHTVEFHLKNIYAKFQVSSRVELILELGKTPGKFESEKLGHSIVDANKESVENIDKLDSQKSWTASFGATVSIIIKELIVKILMKNPSAFLPPVLSLAALITVIVHVTISGFTPQTDEGIAAHIWQILMIIQLPIIIIFIFKWLPQKPIQALAVLALQGGAALVALAPIILLKF